MLNDAVRVSALLATREIQASPDDVRAVVSPTEVVMRQRSEGSTGPEAVERMIEGLEEALDECAAWRQGREAHLEAALRRTILAADRYAAGEDLEDLLAAGEVASQASGG
jgi:hypothetical protein